MIDFRYHLVSLGAVLIALAIGILLGAGPLNDGIGNTLSSEVSQLRQEKDDLRDQLGSAERGNSARDQFDAAVLDRVVEGRLEGRSVAVLSLPQADGRVTDGIEDALESSGASLAPTVDLTTGWVLVSDEAAAARDETGRSALAALGLDGDVDEPAERALGAVLSGRADGEEGLEISDEARAEGWTQLVDGGLIGGSPDLPLRTDLVVVVGAPVAPESTDEDPDPVATEVATSWVRLSSTLGESTSGGVLAATDSRASAPREVSLIHVARQSGGPADDLSTVDAPDIPMGRADVVLALVQQLDGESGHYGIEDDADAAIPDLP